jgi:hypothetical protein
MLKSSPPVYVPARKPGRLMQGLGQGYDNVKSLYKDLSASQQELSACLFLVVIVLSYIQSISSLHSDAQNKTLPIVTLVITIFVTLGILAHYVKLPFFGKLDNYFLPMFLVVLGISLVLAISDVTNKDDKKDKSVPVITLIVDIILSLIVLYRLFFIRA